MTQEVTLSVETLPTVEVRVDSDSPVELRTVEFVSGGGGSTGNYNELSNKPSINGVELSGNKTTDELGLSAPVTSVNGQTGTVSLSIPSSASDVGAIASNQGVGNAGKFMVVDSNGDVVPTEMQTWQGGNF